MLVEMLDAFLAIATSPSSIAIVLGSALVGYMIGVLPGLGVLFGIVVLLPFTLKLPPELGITALMSIFVGAATGGGLTAAVLGIPGTPMATATLLDAYPMSKRGMPGQTIGTVIIASAFGGIFSAIFLTIFAPYLARVAINFGAPEFVVLVLLGLSTVAIVSHGSMAKGFLSAIIGLTLAMVGTDLATAMQRFTFGVPELAVGFGMIPVLLGLFAIPEIIALAEREEKGACVPVKTFIKSYAPKWLTKKDWQRLWPGLFRSSMIGSTVGALPGAGADIAAFVSYGEAKRTAKHPEKFGTGIPEGIVASEAANSAVPGGALIPTLTLGIPGDAATAIIMGVLFMHGLSPGPTLYTLHSDVVAYIYVGLFLAVITVMFIGMFLSGPFIALCSLKKSLLVPVVMLLCVLGVWAVNRSMFDLWTMFAVGLFSYVLRKLEFPLSPIILGFILGPLFEQNLRRALTLSDGSLAIFFTRPYSLAIIILFAVLVFGLIRTLKKTAPAK
ncbi:MAG: tripartite tricarboxylate transporter permease [Syntrophomonadaceae bacterium]|nr:tripartite tricarboxylate transporter permease [Syntrophomonadaceae bacterium]